MKVRWLSHFVPYSRRGGSREWHFNLIHSVSAGHSIYLVTPELARAMRRLSEKKTEACPCRPWPFTY